MRRAAGWLVAVAAFAASATAAAAAPSPGVRVTINDGGSVFVSDADIVAAEGPSEKVTRRDDAGRTSTLEQPGTSLAEIAKLAHVPPRLVDRVDIDRIGTAGSFEISGDEVRHGFTGDPFGLREATVFTGGPGVSFFRPLRDDADANARDIVDTPIGKSLEIRLATTNNARRTVDASADDAAPKPDTPTGFSARVTDPAGTSFSYSWDFADGTTADGAAPSHAFAAGHYRVTVTAVGDDGSAGVSDPIDIQVDAPAGAATPTAVPTPAAEGPATTDGPGGTGGGGGAQTGGGNGSPQDGTSGPKRSPTRTPGKGRPRPRPSAAPAATSAPAATAPAASSPAATAPLRRTHTPPAATPDPTPSPSATKPSKASPDSPGTAIDGILLANAGSPAELQQVLSSAVAAPSAAVRRGGGSGGSILSWVGGGSLLILLLAGGAAAELRGLRS